MQYRELEADTTVGRAAGAKVGEGGGILLVFRNSGNAGNTEELLLMIFIASNSQVSHRRSPKKPLAKSSIGICPALLSMAGSCRLKAASPPLLSVFPASDSHGQSSCWNLAGKGSQEMETPGFSPRMSSDVQLIVDRLTLQLILPFISFITLA